MAQEKPANISIRRSDKNADLLAFASDASNSESEFFIEAGKAIRELVVSGNDELPIFIKRLRALHASGLLFTKKAHPAASMGLSLAGMM